MAWPRLLGTVTTLRGAIRLGSEGLKSLAEQVPSTCKMFQGRYTFPVSADKLLHNSAMGGPTKPVRHRLSPPFTSSRPTHAIPKGWASQTQLSRVRYMLSPSQAAVNGRHLYTANHTRPGGRAVNISLTRPSQLLTPRKSSTLTKPSQTYHLNSDFLYRDKVLTAPLYLVLLNYNLPRCVSWLWNKANVKLCADGGANQLYDHMPSFVEDGRVQQVRKQYWPDLILGDLDSIRDDVRQFYAAGGTLVEDLSYDQDSTDACKCLMHIEQRLLAAEGSPHTILVCGALGGRLDHTLANLNVLHKFPHLNVVLLGDGNMARLVRPGTTTIQLGPDSIEGPRCGLVPLLYPAVVSSTGLKWNVDKTHLSMGGLISTSNMLAGREVSVETDQPLVWTTEVDTDHVMQS